MDRVAFGIVALDAVAWLASLAGFRIPFAGFLHFLFFLSAGYLAVRGISWLRREGLWSLRNRLIVAYLFIAVVPVVLLLIMSGLSAYLIYSQLGAHLLRDDLQKRVEKLADVAEAVASARGARSSSTVAVATLLEASSRELPGIRLEESDGWELLSLGGETAERFAGIVQAENSLWLKAVATRRSRSGRAVAVVSAPLTEELLERLVPEIGPIQLTVTRPATARDPQSQVLHFGDRQFLPVAQIVSRVRQLPAARYLLDVEITGFSNLEAYVPMHRDERTESNPVFISFSARPSQLNRLLFSSLGAFGDFASTALFIMTLVFLVIEVLALRVGVNFTKNITRAVDELSLATQHVQSGDFTRTVRIQQRDQLGALGESFNEMIGSISTLIEGQRQRQRLEHELSIAREVQEQLFPQTIPAVPGIELAAVCRAARTVSGDYYDFISLGPNRLGFAIADISGKGISAALLMASLQAALRSSVLVDQQDWKDTAGLVARLNLHLFLNTSMERYATFFYAAYDASTRTLHYTNAGHLPPVCIVREEVKSLEEGGMVVGLFNDCTYEQGKLHIEEGALLVAYSDGLVEAENVYGEEFGRQGILAEVLRRRGESPQQLAESLVRAAEEWAGSPEQADDMTVVVARMA